MTNQPPSSASRLRFRRPGPFREMPTIELDFTYDATTDVAYLVLCPTGPADVLGPTLLLEPDKEFAGAVSADFTVADGRLVGLEFRNAAASLPGPWLLAAERIDGEHVFRRMEERVGRRLRAASPSITTTAQH